MPSPPFATRSVAPVTGRYDGVLLVDKPAGPTSHDVVAAIRRTFRFEKVGHGGTLDPNATGLLVILLGKGTSLSNMVMGSDKHYAGDMLVGTVTDSQDTDGTVLERKPCDGVTAEQLRERMTALVGDSYQVPPMVSAIKKAGVPLYKLARKGQDVPREPRLVHVYSFRLHSWQPPLAHFDVVCGKGTYVRTLCHDVGQALGCGACLQSLRRIQSGRLNVADAMPLEQILTLDREALAERVIPYYRFLNEYAGQTTPGN
ncbi:MAG: tRNA pseudouridine(55) synthase TruB [Kiritimatiellae bacterium]|nr:tRNA pseudouridine(55) synthase TruB [Kiritimatiellia bacterium]